MNRNANIKITAAGLMLVFTLNLVVGFLCSIGVDMGYNSAHHQRTQHPSLHNTSSNQTENNRHDHSHKSAKHKPEHSNSHAHSKSKSDASKDCCQTSVIQLTQLDKVVPEHHLAHPFFLPLTLPYITYPSTLYTTTAIKNIKQFVRSDHPPIVSDIRIAIRSFQI